MDLEKLEKLNELKEKGILTQEEFDIEKKKILQPEEINVEGNVKIKPQKNGIKISDKTQKINWKNCFISFFVMIFWMFLLGFISVFFTHTTENDTSIYKILILFAAIVYSFRAIAKETYKYKNCAPAWGVFLAIMFLGPIGIWLISYQFLQIKKGFAKHKEAIKERNKIITGIGIVFLFCVSAIIIFTLFTEIKSKFDESSSSEISQTEEQTENLLDILQYFDLSADEIFTENGYSEYHEMMKRWWQTATLKDVTDILDGGLEINKKYQGDMTLILFACNYAENPEIIDELIRRGAAVDLNKAIILASSNENGARIIENLIKRGANVNYKDDWSPLMMAARWNKNPNIIDVLINNGANINDKENGGMTAIQLAAYGNENPQVLESLIKHGGKVDYELLTWAQENSDEMVNLINEYLQKVPLSPNEDCIQAVERAYQRRLEISNDYVMVYPSHTVEALTLDKKINRYSMDGWYVTDFADNGLIISTKCPDAAASMALFGELGAFAASACKEESKFIYTKNTDYATDEVYGKHHLLHEKAGYYKYTTILGKTHSIPAEKELNISISEVEYKTYLRNKDLRCCINNDKISVCK